MRISNFTTAILFLFISTILKAASSQTTYHIKVDQFGYFPLSRKVAVITDPQVGFNAAETFNPGNQRQIRLPALSSGIYYLRVNSSNLIKAEPILIH